MKRKPQLLKNKVAEKKLNTTPRFLLVALSLVLTPFIIFGVTSVELYLNNRLELDNRITVLLPFAILFLVTFLIGYGLHRYYQKHPIIKALLLIYYMAGPIFMLYTFLQQAPLNYIAKGGVLLAVLLLGVGYIYHKTETARVTIVFAWLAVALVVGQTLIVANTLSAFDFNRTNNSGVATNETLRQGADSKDLPNIYHILLDEFQTEMFELTLTEEVSSEMGGFVYYPENITIFGRTGMSLPTIFTGKSYNYSTPQIEYQQAAFGSNASFLYWLKEAGYKTRAYIHKIYTFELPLFDEVIEHHENAQMSLEDEVYTRLFMDIWLYANTPSFIAEKVVDPEFLRQIEAQNVLPDTAPVLSYESFNSFIQDENTLNESNIYTFVHLILPHFPHVLQSDCSYDENTESSPRQQAECATKLTIDFLNTLKQLDRYDNSLIIIQSDHGAQFRIEDEDLVRIEKDHYSEEWSLARARTLLLIKTPDRNSTDSFQTSSAETTLLDIAPTIVESLGINTGMSFDGFSLANPKAILPTRIRHYHFFEKKGKNELTDEMHRFILENNNIRFDKIIPINR